MRKIRFLVDENTTRSISNQLLRRKPEIEIFHIGDDMAPPLGTIDPYILLWLEREGYCLVTRNRASMPQHLRDHIKTGHHIPGIFTLKPRASIGQIVEELLLIWELAEPDEYQDQIVYIPFG